MYERNAKCFGGWVVFANRSSRPQYNAEFKRSFWQNDRPGIQEKSVHVDVGLHKAMGMSSPASTSKSLIKTKKVQNISSRGGDHDDHFIGLTLIGYLIRSRQSWLKSAL